MRGTRVVGLLVVAMLAVAGCGSDDGGDDGGGLSQEELNTQSAEICREGRAALNNLEDPGDLSDPEQAAAFLTDAVEIFDKTIADLRALEPEEDLQADYDAYLEIVEENGDELKGILEKAEAKDPSGQEDLVQYLQDEERDERTKEAAREAGLTGCANS